MFLSAKLKSLQNTVKQKMYLFKVNCFQRLQKQIYFINLISIKRINYYKKYKLKRIVLYLTSNRVTF